MHYFERWDAHNKARDKARQEAARTAGEALEALSDLDAHAYEPAEVHHGRVGAGHRVPPQPQVDLRVRVLRV